jgi:tetrahydromethanopterin S-methyltransferase subunit G
MRFTGDPCKVVPVQVTDRIRHHARELWLGRDVAVCYGAAVVGIGVALAIAPPEVAHRIVNHSSTNLVNLRERPLSVLFASPFVIYPISGSWLVAPMVVAFGVLQRWLGRAGLIAVVVLGHVGATLVVATMQVTSLTRGLIDFDVAVGPDVGISYGLATVAGVLVARVPRTWRRRYLLASLAVVVGQGLVLRNFTGLGHVVAWVIGLAVALLVARGARAVDQPVRQAGSLAAVER